MFLCLQFIVHVRFSVSYTNAYSGHLHHDAAVINR